MGLKRGMVFPALILLLLAGCLLVSPEALAPTAQPTASLERQGGRLPAPTDATGTALAAPSIAPTRSPRARPTRAPTPGPRGAPPPDISNQSYGPYARNVLDLWLAQSDVPAPLVIYFHGGGFRGGDKSSLNLKLLLGLLERGISVAAANYRLSDEAPFPAQMHDAARAVQFLRLQAQEYGLDPGRFGATGGSAGAGISLWLAFHDDLADLDNVDPVLQQSTRLSVAVVYAAQSSYDPRFFRELFETEQMDPGLLPFYGMNSFADIDSPQFFPLFEEASPVNHLTADDPPVMLFYPQPNQPLPPNPGHRDYIHHPKFGIYLKQEMDELGIECQLRLREDYPESPARSGPVEDYIAFLTKYLLP